MTGPEFHTRRDDHPDIPSQAAAADGLFTI